MNDISADYLTRSINELALLLQEMLIEWKEVKEILKKKVCWFNTEAQSSEKQEWYEANKREWSRTFDDRSKERR